MSTGGDHEGADDFIVKLRGLPWSATTQQIKDFFGVKLKNNLDGIHLTTLRDGRPSGEAYVELATSSDLDLAVKKDRDHMGHRYIEVFKVKRVDMELALERNGCNESMKEDGCVKLRGLPFGCSKEEICQFFSGERAAAVEASRALLLLTESESNAWVCRVGAGLEIVPNGISLALDPSGRTTGDAYVQFSSREVAETAMQRHKQKIGHRYIEIFPSCLADIRAAMGPKMRPSSMWSMNGGRPAPYDLGDRFGGVNRFGGARNGPSGPGPFKGGYNDFNNGPPGPYGGSGGGGGGGGGYTPWAGGRFGGGGGGSGNNFHHDLDGPSGGGFCIHMRGLPFRASERDIADFFRPIMPIHIKIIYDKSGRASGEADVEFASHEDAIRSMGKNKSNMQHRYIELFLNSSPPPSYGGSGPMGGGCPPMGNMPFSRMSSNFT